MNNIYVAREFENEKVRYADGLRKVVSNYHGELCQIKIPANLIILAWKKIKQNKKNEREAIEDVWWLHCILLDIKTGWENRKVMGNDLYVLAREFFDLAYDFMGYGESRHEFNFEPSLDFVNGEPELTLISKNYCDNFGGEDKYPYQFTIRSYERN